MGEKKGKLLTSLEKNGTKSKRQKLHFGDFKKLDKAVFTWFIRKKSQQIRGNGVIRSLKVHYQRKIVRLCNKALDKNKPLLHISIIQAMKDLVSS